MFHFILRILWTWVFIILSLCEKNLENKKKLMPVRILNSVCLISKNIVNNVGIYNESDAMNSSFKEGY